jgi:DUF917 family protein
MSRHIAGHDLEYLATGSWIFHLAGDRARPRGALRPRRSRGYGGRDIAGGERQAALPRQGDRRAATHHGRFLRGTTRFAGLDGDAGSIFEIAFQNEFTVGWRDGSVAVTTSDLICVLDSVSGEAIGTESLRYGQRVSAIALPSPQIHRTAKGLQHVGPRAFGYDIPFKSVFVEEKAELVA